MKFSSKRTISRLVAFTMLVTSVFSNVIVANADVDLGVDAVASGSAVEAQLDGTTIYTTDLQATYPSGIPAGTTIADGVKMANTNGTEAAIKTTKDSAVYTFNNGECSGDLVIEFGKGNSSISTAEIGATISASQLEKYLLITAPSAGKLTVYGYPGTSGFNEADVILVKAGAFQIVDAGKVVNDNKNVTVPTLTIPEAGTYAFLVPGGIGSDGASMTSLNIVAINLVYGDVAPETTTEEPTTEATTEEPTTEATTEEPTTEATTEAPTDEPTTEATTVEPTTEEPTAEPTTELVIGDNEIGIQVANVVYDEAAKTVKATYQIVGNTDAKGFNNYTMTLDYDPSILAPVSLEPGLITCWVEGVDATGARYDANAASASSLAGDKVAYCIWTEGTVPADGSGAQLPEFTANGDLFTITYSVVGTGTSTIGAAVETINTVSANDTIAGALTPVVVAGEVTIPGEAPTEEPTEATTEEPTEAPTEEPTEAPTEEPTEAPTEEPTEAPTEAPTETPTEAPTTAPTTEAPTEAPTTAPTTEAPTEATTAAVRPSSGGGGGGGGSVKTVTTTVATTEAAVEATTAAKSTTGTPKPVITKDVRVTIGVEAVVVGSESYGVDTAPYIQEASSSTLVPLRVVAIAILGEDPQNADQLTNIVKWDGATKTATIYAGDIVVMFTAGSDSMVVGGKTMLMENGVKAEIKDSRMYVPFRALGKALGVEVDWDAEARTAIYKAPVTEEEAAEEAAEETPVTLDSVKGITEGALAVAKVLADNTNITDEAAQTTVKDAVTLLEAQVANLADETLEFTDEDLANINDETMAAAAELVKIAQDAGLDSDEAFIEAVAEIADLLADDTDEAAEEAAEEATEEATEATTEAE